MSLAVIICLAVAVIGMATHAQPRDQGNAPVSARVAELEAEVAALRSEVVYLRDEATDHEKRLQFQETGRAR